MKLIDMQRPKKTLKGVKGTPLEENDRYPYGLRIRFDEKDLAKVKELQGVDAGDQVTLQCSGMVIEVSVTNRESENKRQSVEIQIHKIGVINKSDDKTAFKNA